MPARAISELIESSVRNKLPYLQQVRASCLRRIGAGCSSPAIFFTDICSHRGNKSGLESKNFDALEEVADTVTSDDGQTSEEHKTYDDPCYKATERSKVNDIYLIGLARRALIWIGLGLASLAGLMAGTLMAVWTFHAVAGQGFGWLHPDEVAQVQTILFSGALSAVATLLGRTVLRTSDEPEQRP